MRKVNAFFELVVLLSFLLGEVVNVRPMIVPRLEFFLLALLRQLLIIDRGTE